MDMANFSEIKNEIVLDAQGRGFITRRALAKLLGIAPTTLIPNRMSKKLLQALSVVKDGAIKKAGKPCNPDDVKDTDLLENDAINPDWVPDIEIPIYAQHFAYIARSKSLQAAEVIKAFAAVGIRKWIQTIKEETPVLKPVQEPSSQKLMLQAMKELMKVYEYADDKEGLQNILDFAKVQQSASLEGAITVMDVFTEMGIVPSRSLNTQVCLQAASAYRNLTQEEPLKVRRYSTYDKGDKKRYAYNLVNAYPVECKVIVENAIMKHIGRYKG